MSWSDDRYGKIQNVRDPRILGRFIGQRVLDILQHDAEDLERTGHHVELLFEGGGSVKFFMGADGSFVVDHHEVEPEG